MSKKERELVSLWTQNTEKLVKARSRKPSNFILSRCFETLVKNVLPIFRMASLPGIIINKRNFHIKHSTFFFICTRVLICDRNKIFLRVFQKLLLEVSTTICIGIHVVLSVVLSSSLF